MNINVSINDPVELSLLGLMVVPECEFVTRNLEAYEISYNTTVINDGAEMSKRVVIYNTKANKTTERLSKCFRLMGLDLNDTLIRIKPHDDMSYIDCLDDAIDEKLVNIVQWSRGYFFKVVI